MAVFSLSKTKRAIDNILDKGDVADSRVKSSLDVLLKDKVDSAEKVLEQMKTAPKVKLGTLIKLLELLIDDDNVKLIMDALPELDRQSQREVSIILNRSRRFDPNRALPYLNNKIPLEIQTNLLTAHHERLNPLMVLKFVGKCDPQLWDILFEVIVSGADKSILPEAIAASHAKNPEIKRRIATLLARFNTPAVAEALTRMASDENRDVRLNALRGLKKIGRPPKTQTLIQLLRQAQKDEQSLIKDLLLISDTQGLGGQLAGLLLEEQPQVNGIVLELLPQIINKDLLVDLLIALKDKDVWTREKVTDKLVTIQDPAFYNAFSELAQTEDDYLRATTLDILQNSEYGTSGEFALKLLLASLDDEDFMVRQKAMAKVADNKETRAIPKLIEIAKKDAGSRPTVLQTLQKVGDPEALPLALFCLDDPEILHQRAALECIPDINSAETAPKVRQFLTNKIDKLHVVLRKTALEVIEELGTRFSLPADASIERRLQDVRNQIADDEEALRKQDQSGGETTKDQPKEALDDFTEGMLLGKRYKLVREIGKGGYGSVWLVEDTMINERMVMKFLREELTSDQIAIERFIRELRFARKLSHPNIIRLHDYLNLDNVAAISMEYFDGDTLSTILHQTASLEPAQILDISLKVAEGLKTAHDANIIHRDMKPANVMINDAGEVKVVDFGIAAASKQNESKLTRTGTLIGTPTYISPEQIQGKEIDGRTDIYSLGIMMYEMATGSPPYTADDPMALIFQHIEGRAQRIDEIKPEFPEGLADVIHKAMRPNPDERYANMGELIADMKQLQGSL